VRYLGFIIVIVAVWHTLSYARYSLGNGNKSAALGALLIAVLTVLAPVIAIFVAG